MKLYDVHSHFLPKIDDGAQSSDMSLAMLAEAVKQGVYCMAATSHYYSNEQSIEEYLAVRAASVARVQERLAMGAPAPQKLLLGAEVYLTRGLSLRDDLEALCYEGTKLILIELPYGPWGNWVYREVEQIISNCALRVVLAHPERYLYSPWDRKKLKPFEEMDVIYQLNAEDVLEQKRLTGQLLNSGKPCILGSDAHNTDRRRNYMREAAERLEKLYGRQLLLDMEQLIQKEWGL